MKGDQIVGYVIDSATESMTLTASEWLGEHLSSMDDSEVIDLARSVDLGSGSNIRTGEMIRDYLFDLWDVIYGSLSLDSPYGQFCVEAFKMIDPLELSDDLRSEIDHRLSSMHPEPKIYLGEDHPTIGAEIVSLLGSELLEAGFSETDLEILSYGADDPYLILDALDHLEEYGAAPDGWLFDHSPMDHYQICSEIIRDISDTPLWIDSQEYLLTFESGSLYLIREDLADLLIS